MKIFTFIGFILLSINTLYSQKKVIDYTAFDGWKTVKNEQISPSGKWISYEVQPHKGDTYLYWYNTETNVLDSVLRAKNASFSFDESQLIYTIEAGYDTLRKVELAKVDKKKWPKDSLAVYSLIDKKLQKFPNVKESKVSEKHAWLVFLENDNTVKEEPAKDEKSSKKKKKKTTKKKASKKKEKTEPTKKEPKTDGKVLRLQHLQSGKKYVFKNVVSYELSEFGEWLTYVEQLDGVNTIHVLDLKNDASTKLDKTYGGVEGLVFDKTTKRLAYLASEDTTKIKVFELMLVDLSSKAITCLVDTTSTAIRKGWTVVKNEKPMFSKVLNRIYFAVNDTPVQEPKDTLIESEKPKLDIWTYNESVLQTQQLASLKKDQNKFYWHAYDFATGQTIEMENDTLNIQSNIDELTDFALLSNKRPYELEYMWDISGKKDYYRINLKDGSKQLIKKGVTSAVNLSRKGDQFVYFNHENGQYYSIDIASAQERCMTCSEKGKTWSQDNNGMPMEYAAIGNLGWSKDGTTIYLSEKNDVFSYDFKANQLLAITQNIGSKNNIEFEAKRWNTDSTFIELDNLYFIGLDKVSKGSHYYSIQNNELKKEAVWDAKIVSMKKAKNAATFTVRKQTVVEYPDLAFWKSSPSGLKQISFANPQQKAYNWATVELINWKTYKGLELQGLVYKPENFDASKSYPLLVYYYELYSDDLHNHYTPRPTASIIFPTEYASAGYVVFIPDVRYESGHPANSAYDCIMSGTDAVLKKYPNIDEKRMGLQGQSWGGYQTAQLITMTKRYKAAMAGAPVGNMFSAYGGIRWGTGMSRQFQYEKTQSRIGKTMWEAPELYIENSPVFHLPKVETPLLIMHNDKDGAVPWYQGVEIFTGLRRLGKPAWLLNYNDDDHNLMKMANRRDLSIRMRQFFDHYLQNQPAPRWLTEGIPALKKGKELRYEMGEN